MFGFRSRQSERFELLRAIDTLRNDIERRLTLLERDSATFEAHRNDLISTLSALEARVRMQVHRLNHVPQTTKDNGALLDAAVRARKGL